MLLSGQKRLASQSTVADKEEEPGYLLFLDVSFPHSPTLSTYSSPPDVDEQIQITFYRPT
jgi:hypothetical protein